MDLSVDYLCGRLPRMRAGVPYGTYYPAAVVLVAPYAGGSSVMALAEEMVGGVAPYAGGSSEHWLADSEGIIGCPVCGREFLHPVLSGGGAAGLPRMRAGVPHHSARCERHLAVAPYAGGSSFQNPIARSEHEGCPVCGREFLGLGRY